MRRGRAGSDAALLLLLFVLLRGRFSGGSGPFGGAPRRWYWWQDPDGGPHAPSPRRPQGPRPPFSPEPGPDNLGTVPLPPNPLAMPEPEPGVIRSPGWPQRIPG